MAGYPRSMKRCNVAEFITKLKQTKAKKPSDTLSIIRYILAVKNIFLKTIRRLLIFYTMTQDDYMLTHTYQHTYTSGHMT